LQAWVWFTQRLASRDNSLVAPLRPLLIPAIEALGTDELYPAAVELLSDILANYPSFPTEEYYDTILSLFDSPWSRERYENLLRGDFDFESVQFGQFMVAFGDARVDRLMQALGSKSQAYLSKMGGLLATQGFAVGEDKIFTPALEFWSTFVETMADSVYSEDEEPQAWVTAAMSHVMDAVSNSWRKAAFPPAHEFSLWDSSERVSFNDARKDVADFLQSVFTLSGPQLITSFAEFTLAAHSSHSWAELEAAAFCLGSLADCVISDARGDPVLGSLFSSNLFDILQQSRPEIPTRVRQTCVSLIERYADYFERNPTSLASALNLLFLAVADPALALPASRSIQRLCSSSRSHLTLELDVFLAQYGALSSQITDCQAIERIVGAIASIAQAAQDDATMAQGTRALLEFINRDVENCLQLLELTRSGHLGGMPPNNEHRCLSFGPDSDLPQHLAMKVLRCLVSMGKGFQSPADGPVDVDADSDTAGQAQSQEVSAVQGHVLSIVLSIQTAFPESGEVMEGICNIFRSGFSEYEPGPFVFPPEMVASYLVRQTSATPRIGTVMSTACSFISSLGKTPNRTLRGTISQVLSWVIRLLQVLPRKLFGNRIFRRYTKLHHRAGQRHGSGPEWH
jgi:hypothetical protein